MSSDQPSPGSGEPPDDDPFRKGPQPPPADGAGGAWGGGSPPPPPPGGAGGPYVGGGGGPYRGAPGGGRPYGGGPYGGGPQGGDPYGSGSGVDPLAGMPPLANRGRRLLARIIDGLLIAIPVGVIMSLIVGGYDPTDPDDTGRSATVQGTVMLVYFIYEGLMLSNSGQTVGKKLMNIRVALLDNGGIPAGSAGWIRAAVYTLPEFVPCCGFIFWLINVLNCTWDKPYQQCLHDKAAKTVVVAVT
ncbi:RDD family protein [Streptomyces sp. NPDC001922]|uniref:RDD family protein n=1 Tax=Streptomyces sp. NPDC001922 TaxID=3364624 RepID=UPI0036CDD913